MNLGTLTVTRSRESHASKPTVGDAIKSALTHGQMIDASPLGYEAGFKWPVYVTKAAWEHCVEWSAHDADRCEVAQDENNRLWELLTWLMYHKENAMSCILEFSFFQIPRGAVRRELFLFEVKAVISPGIGGLPCITIMLPFED
jgi:hypothetical protein